MDGLILIAVENSEQQIKYLIKSEIPFVLVDRSFPNINTNHILLNNYKAAYQCTDYLAKQGYKRIGFINYKTSLFPLSLFPMSDLKADYYFLRPPYNPGFVRVK